MSFVSKDPWKFSLDEPEELKRSNEFKPYPHHFWEAQTASLFPKYIFLIEDPEPSISYIHIPFILNTKNGYPEDMLTMGHLKTELIYIRILPR